MKNKFGQVASRYDVTQPGALQNLLNDPQIKEMMPGATIVQHANMDMLDPDGDGPMAPVDVIRSAVAGGSGAAWQWGAGGDGQAAQGPQGPSASAYQMGLQPPQQGVPQGGQVGPEGAPEVGDQNSAMQFLQWLMQQQQQGQIGQNPGQSFF